MKPIISVRDLGKMYRIRSEEKKRYRTLREELVEELQKLCQGKFGQSKTEEFWALKDIEFDIYPGEVVGIIGRNGAGKSTLLKILSRITPPTTGEAILRGRVGSLLEVGTGFHPELTGRENIYLSGAILGMSRGEIKKKFDEIVAFAEVERFIDTPVKRYSSGMYVRLAFGVAAHLEPEILVVDEVLAVGDVQFQKKCLGKMGEVAKGGRTVLFVSHQMGAIAQLCTQALLLSQGSIVQQGDTPYVIDYYLKQGAAESQYAIPASVADLDKDMYITQAQAVNSQGEATSNFSHAEEIFIIIRYRINRFIPDTEIGFNIKDIKNRIVFRSETPILNLEVSNNEAIIKAKIPSALLVPNQYFFTLFIHLPFVKIVDLAEDAFTITIIDSGSKFARYDGKVDYGCVFVECEWSLEN